MDHVLDMSRAEALCKEENCRECRCGPLFNTFMLGLPAYNRAMRCMGAGQLWQEPGPAPLRRRRRAEMLVGGHVRCDCERHGTLIENRSTTVDAQGARLQRSSCDRGPAAKCATLRWSTKSRTVSTAAPRPRTRRPRCTRASRDSTL